MAHYSIVWLCSVTSQSLETSLSESFTVATLPYELHINNFIKLVFHFPLTQRTVFKLNPPSKSDPVLA